MVAVSSTQTYGTRSGLSPGTLRVAALSLLAGSTLVMELGATQRDLVVVSGDAFLAGTLELRMTGGYLPRAGDSVILFDIGGVQQGAFSQVLFPTLAPGFQYRFASAGGDFALLALNDAQPVPEPAMVVLLLCGLVVIGWRVRRAGDHHHPPPDTSPHGLLHVNPRYSTPEVPASMLMPVPVT